MNETRGGRMIRWPQDGTRRGELDQAIDRAVCEMMNVDADTAFRARVLARLERRASHWFTRSHVALCSGAIVGALVLALVLMQPAQDVAPTGNVGREPAQTSTSQASSDHAAVRRNLAREGAARRPVERSVGRASVAERSTARRTFENATQSVPAGTVVASVAEQSPAATGIDSLDRIEPIGFAPIRPSVIAPPPIVIAPLTPIAAIQVTPLSARSERD